MRLAACLLLASTAIAVQVRAPYAAGNGTVAACDTGAGGTSGGGHERVAAPTSALAWRARVLSNSPVHRRLSRRSSASATHELSAHEPLPLLTPDAAKWVLVLGARRDTDGRCWLKVRLPWRPNDAVGWVQAAHLQLQPTPWRLLVSLAARAVTLDRSGVAVYRARVVVGAQDTPTPRGLFAITSVWRSPPKSFLGAYILPLTAHSEALPHFDGGDGQVALHGRGGASLLDPLGSASSHGCVRLANRAINAIVRLIGRPALPGTPVLIQ